MIVIDAALHPPPPRPEDLRPYLDKRWGSTKLPRMTQTAYAPPPELQDDSEWGTLLSRALSGSGGSTAAILLPSLPGRQPDPRFGAAIAAALNEWQLERCIGDDPRLRGSILVCPDDTAKSVSEIERRARDERFVQVLVPLRSIAPYGSSAFWPIWEAAAEHGLPVAFSNCMGAGAELPASTVGVPVWYLEWYELVSYAAAVHVGSLLAAGAFEAIPDARFVVADGSFDWILCSLMRLDKHWRSMRSELPWLTKDPTAYLVDHVRFVLAAGDGPLRAGDRERFLGILGGRELLLYGSNLPSWDSVAASDALAGAGDELRSAVLSGNALSFYPRVLVNDRDSEAA